MLYVRRTAKVAAALAIILSTFIAASAWLAWLYMFGPRGVPTILALIGLVAVPVLQICALAMASKREQSEPWDAFLLYVGSVVLLVVEVGAIAVANLANYGHL